MAIGPDFGWWMGTINVVMFCAVVMAIARRSGDG
jgi:hypothetical protein